MVKIYHSNVISKYIHISRKKHTGGAQRNVYVSLHSLPLMRVHTAHYSSSNTCTIYVPREAHQRLHALGFYKELIIGTLCLTHTRIPNSQKKSRCAA